MACFIQLTLVFVFLGDDNRDNNDNGRTDCQISNIYIIMFKPYYIADVENGVQDCPS